MSSLVEREIALNQAQAVVSACRRCAIGSIRRNAVYGAGLPSARVMIIGEGPGETEDKTGLPFVGRAGELLTKMLAAIELTRDDVYIANTVKCRPTLDEGGRLKNRPPTLEEMSNCRPYLDEQIEILQPSVILCLGAPAAKSFLGKNFAITKQRGQWFIGPRNIPLIVTFHPAYVLRLTGGTLSEVKRLVYDDLLELRKRLDGGVGEVPTSSAMVLAASPDLTDGPPDEFGEDNPPASASNAADPMERAALDDAASEKAPKASKSPPDVIQESLF